MPGVASVEELRESLAYFTATEEDRDFSEINDSLVAKFQNQCMYCNHCQPCPAGIDIGLVNKYYDLAQKYMPDGSCGVISFGLKGGRKSAEVFMKHLQLGSIETHVADSRTCCLHPASATHRQMTDEQLDACGVGADLIRLSCGLENAEDLIADLQQAVEKA